MSEEVQSRYDTNPSPQEREAENAEVYAELERKRVAAEAENEWFEYLDSDDYKEQQYNEAMERAEAEHYRRLEQARALGEKLEEFAAARWPITQAGAVEAVHALLDLEGAMKDAGYHPAGRTRTGAGDPVTALQDVLREAHPQQMSLAVDDLAKFMDSLVDMLYNRNLRDDPATQKAVRNALLRETKRMAMLPSSRVEAAEIVTGLVDYVNTASYVPLTPEQEMQAEAAAHEAAAKQAEQETAHQAEVELGVQASRAPEAGRSESTIASRVEELWAANQREAAESRRKIMSAHELGGYGLPQSGGRSNPPARASAMGTVEEVGQGVPRAATLGDTTMLEDARKPSRQTRFSAEDQKTHAGLHSRDAAVRMAAASGALSAGMLEEALSSRRKDVRQAALMNQPLTPSTVSHFVQNGSVSDRLIIASHPGLTAGAVSELLRDTSARVRLATIEHQEINPEWLDLTLQVTRGRELLAVIQHNALTPTQVEGLLEDRDGRVRLATVQYQALSTDQAGRLLDEYATSSNAIEMEIRRAAVDRAEPGRLQAATADRDPVVAERARQELDAVAADMVARIEAASNLASDDAWAQAGQREIDHEAAREAQATARDQAWWFDQAWEERAELLGSVGTRPEDPQASLASLVRDRDEAAERLGRLQRSAGMLPLGSRGILDQHVADANAQAARAAAQVAAVEATILNGTHPQALACAKFDAENGAAAERIAELNRQCIQGLSALSKDDWTVAPLPTSAVAQAVWLARFGQYAAAAAHVERTGTVAEADVAARIAHHAMAVDTAFRVSRGGYTDETELSYGF